MAYFWLIVIIILSFIEILTIDVVTIWFIASALVTIMLSFVIDNFIIQFAIFTILGIILLLTTKPIVKKFSKKKDVKTNFDRIIGMEGIITDTITSNSVGEVKVDGKHWSAISDTKIDKGTPVIIEEIQGVKLKVRKR